MYHHILSSSPSALRAVVNNLYSYFLFLIFDCPSPFHNIFLSLLLVYQWQWTSQIKYQEKHHEAHYNNFHMNEQLFCKIMILACLYAASKHSGSYSFFSFFLRVDLTLLCGFSLFLDGILCSVVLIK